MKFLPINTRYIVITGYCLLVILAISGFITIFFEVINSNKQSENSTILKTELINLSNTLTTMYKAEGTATLLAFSDNENLIQEYESLIYRAFSQIDSLRFTSSDPNVVQNLDTLSVLLAKKRDNSLKMIQLIKQIDTSIIQEITKRSIVTRYDIDKLNNLLANVMQVTEDTVQVLSERKGFLQRLRAVVKPDANNTLTQITKGSASQINEIISPLVIDTIVDFFRQIGKQTQKKNAEVMRQLFTHHRELYVINEHTGLQINMIMDALKEREYQSNLEILNEKNHYLKRSASLVAIIGLSALIVAVFFMSWTLRSLNKSQRLQKNIQEAKKHAEKLLISREQLIYTITHDIKAPLSSITGFLDLLMSELALSQKQQYYVKNMHSSASHIQDLVRNLLDFHSIEKEQPKLTSIAFLPASLICNIYESFLPLVQKKKMAFDLKSSVPETGVFLSDPYYIRQIVNNLLSNAIKFTPEQGRISLTTSLEEQNRWKISVQDNGSGIDPADQAKIFEEFVRLDKTKNEVEGTGLGLTISKKLTNLLGGTIEIESQNGIGSIFTLTIPLTHTTEETIAIPDDSSDISSGRILFVDDDRAQLNLLSEWMKKEDLPCVYCSSAWEALDVLRKKSFNIIFTDIHIPDMEGFELVKRIRKLNFPKALEIPVIACSAGYQKSESELEEAGFNGFLLKPFYKQQLLEILEKHTSYKPKIDESCQENNESGWRKVMDFVADDQDAAMKIIGSFIEETKKDRESMIVAFQEKNNEDIKRISHKMLSLMRMISAQKIVSILIDFEKGAISEEKKDVLLRFLEETLKEAETTLQVLDGLMIKND